MGAYLGSGINFSEGKQPPLAYNSTMLTRKKPGASALLSEVKAFAHLTGVLALLRVAKCTM